METLAFDPRMGASGDMILAALLDAGADPDALDPVEAALDLSYEAEQATRNGIAGTSVTVALTTDHPESEHHDHSHSHDHGESHTHEHENNDAHSHDHAEGSGPTRSYTEVVEIIETIELTSAVESKALEIVRLLGEAEASVHGTELDETHFHEVGADDAIADIVGAALLFDDLAPEQVVTTPVATGGGEVSMSHGTYPVPVPAVLELAERSDWSLRSGPVDAELLTPTGAAILAVYADGVERLPTLTVETSGYGVGGYTFEDHPNVLRAIRGQSTDELTRDPVTVLETNLDDATPEELGGLQETLSDAGALDVSILPATMKKSRPGHLVKIIVKPEDADRVARRLAVETGTLGVREHGRGHRLIADREYVTVTVETDAGPAEIGVKIASIGDEVFDVSAEFDDAAAAATDEPVRELMRRAEQAAREAF